MMIKEAFDKVLPKKIMSVEEELKDEDWITFNHAVLQSFGLDSYYLRISHSLLSMRQVRKTAREAKKKTTIVTDINKQRKVNEENVIYETALCSVNPHQASQRCSNAWAFLFFFYVLRLDFTFYFLNWKNIFLQLGK